VAREAREWRAVKVRGEIGAHRIASLLAHVFLPVLGVKPRHLVQQDRDFIRLEKAWKEKVAVAIQSRPLFRVELHGVLLCLLRLDSIGYDPLLRL
jgi:hypothetical protein